MARTFDFGGNWEDYSIVVVDQQRLADAAASIQSLLRRQDLRDQRFLDVGCGSGLFSLAAQRLGAEAVVGIDINPRCVAISEQNRLRLAPESAGTLTFLQVSALDDARLRALGEFDVVYAWGSLHHTGAMAEAIRLVAQRVGPGGTFVLAIYNRHFTSPAWLAIKWLYNHLPHFCQRLMVPPFAGLIYIAKFIVTRENPLKKERGMHFWYDVIDWLGGYPYECASPAEIVEAAARFGFTQRHFVKASVPTGCNEFVFSRDV